MARPTAARTQARRAARQRDTTLKTLTAAGVPAETASRIVASGAGAEFAASPVLKGSAAVFKPGRTANPHTDRGQIAQWWQIEAYRHVHICGEARYAVALYSNVAGRAEVGISEPQTMARKPVWVNSGPEVDVLAEVAPTVRDRTALVRAFMTHWVIAGECYLIARERTDTDPPSRSAVIWEIVGVTELRKIGDVWSVRHDNGNYLNLHASDPVIRLWNPDPENRREAWSPFRSLLPTLREIEWLTKHIFTQVRSRLLGAGVWFLPENLTFAPPPLEILAGDDDEERQQTLDSMNEAEQFMVSLANSSMDLLESDEVGFPSVVMADAAALANVDQAKLIQFWSEIDTAAMQMRTEDIRRFALGMDLPSGKAVDPVTVASGANGGSGGANHWGKWAEQEEMISEHIEPGLDAFTGSLTTALLWLAVDGTDKVVAYDTASMRLKQDLSKAGMEWYDRGELKAEVALREGGFDPTTDMPDEAEFRRWALKKILSGNPTPEMMASAAELLRVTLPGDPLPVAVSQKEEGGGLPGVSQAPNNDEHPYQGPPREQHDHSPAPYGVRVAQAEALVLRALEKAGNRLLNQGKRGRERTATDIQPFAAHVAPGLWDGSPVSFDFTTASVVLDDMDPQAVGYLTREMGRYCAYLYENGLPHSRKALIENVRSL